MSCLVYALCKVTSELIQLMGLMHHQLTVIHLSIEVIVKSSLIPWYKLINYRLWVSDKRQHGFLCSSVPLHLCLQVQESLYCLDTAFK